MGDQRLPQSHSCSSQTLGVRRDILPRALAGKAKLTPQQLTANCRSDCGPLIRGSLCTQLCVLSVVVVLTRESVFVYMAKQDIMNDGLLLTRVMAHPSTSCSLILSPLFSFCLVG